MPRRGPVAKRDVRPDLVYNEMLVTKLINKIMWDGKKSIAENLVYGALDEIAARTKEDPMVVLRKAIENARPRIEVRPRRVGGATYQVPVEVDPRRGLTLAVRWIVDATRSREGKAFEQHLADELLDAYNETGTVIKRKEDLYRMAEANRAFAHYRW